MTIEASLLSILACPEDKGPLFYIESEQVLYNPRLKRVYKVVDGIPVMLIEESVNVDGAEGERLEGLIRDRGIKPTFSR
jgi:uncharacterized protein YbaR (Trm112 family)